MDFFPLLAFEVEINFEVIVLFHQVKISLGYRTPQVA